MITFHEFIKRARMAANRLRTKATAQGSRTTRLTEHQVYRSFPGEKTSYRIDSGNTNTATTKHAHIFAKPNGRGQQLYSVNLDGSGHDGSSGYQISQSHAEHLKRLGFSIPSSNVLEEIDYDEVLRGGYTIIMMSEEDGIFI